MRPWLLHPYHRLLLLRDNPGEANFVGWFAITLWLLIGYVVYIMEAMSKNNYF